MSRRLLHLLEPSVLLVRLVERHVDAGKLLPRDAVEIVDKDRDKYDKG